MSAKHWFITASALACVGLFGCSSSTRALWEGNPNAVAHSYGQALTQATSKLANDTARINDTKSLVTYIQIEKADLANEQEYYAEARADSCSVRPKDADTVDGATGLVMADFDALQESIGSLRDIPVSNDINSVQQDLKILKLYRVSPSANSAVAIANGRKALRNSQAAITQAQQEGNGLDTSARRLAAAAITFAYQTCGRPVPSLFLETAVNPRQLAAPPTLATTKATIDWGDVPTWVGSIGTLLAFAIALVLFAQSMRDRRSSRARLVSAWVSGGPAIISAAYAKKLVETHENAVRYEGVSLSERVGMIQITVRNHGDELISDIRATLVNEANDAEWGIDEQGWVDIGPGQQTQRTLIYIDSGITGGCRVQLEFTDALRRRWTRMGGSLTFRRVVPPKAASKAKNPPCPIWAQIDYDSSEGG